MCTDDPDGRIRHHVLVFDDPERTLAAVKVLRSLGYEIGDVHSPFPVHGLSDALGLPPSRLSRATFVGGVTGLSLAVFLQLWTHARDWPLNIGGKTNLAGPALVPVAFELTVLLAAFGTVGALVVLGRLVPSLTGKAPASQPVKRVTDDQFAVLVVEQDASFSPAAFAQVCERLEPVQIRLDWRAP